MKIPITTLREALVYDKTTGKLIWRSRPRAHFKSDLALRSWEGQRSGKEAGRKTNTGYIQIGITISGKLVQEYAHRIIWAMEVGLPLPKEIDHVNRIRTDNRLENLREANASSNQANTKMRSNNTSGHRGVSRKGAKWVANICVRGIKCELGRFDSKELAAKAYKTAYEIAFRSSATGPLEGS